MNFGAKFRHAFAVDGEKAEPTPEQSAAVDAFARWVARRGMTSPILLMLESSKPLNGTVAQGLHFADPVLGAVLRAMTAEQVRHLATFLEHRGSIDFITARIEAIDAEQRAEPENNA